jgi:transposase
VTIPKELEAKVLRLHHVEHWLVGTIATQLGVHHTTVERVLSQAGVPAAEQGGRPSIVDPFLPFIRETLETYPKLTAARLLEMVRLRGYPGHSDGHFRRAVALVRPRPAAEAFFRLRTLPGEQAQVDWGHFGELPIGRARRSLMAFVLVLSFSRQIFLRFFVNQRLHSFLAGHVAAFDQLAGVPRVVLYDNPKTVVLERIGDAIRFHPALLELARHYCFEPRPVAVARGNEKGRVERAIRYVRQSFWPARTFRDLDDLNAQAAAWCEGVAADRLCPEDRSQTVRAAFEHEREKLLALPHDRFPDEELVEVTAGKTPYVRFDLNDYSVPHTHVRRDLTVLASQTRVRVLDGTVLIADHARSYDKGAQVEDQAHLAALTERKAAARKSRGMDRLRAAVPRSHDLLSAAAEQGHNIGAITAMLLRLLDQWGATELDAAVDEALARGVPHPHAVRQSLERRRQERDLPPLVAVPLPDDPRVKELVVRPHDLGDYDLEETTAMEETDGSDDTQ